MPTLMPPSAGARLGAAALTVLTAAGASWFAPTAAVAAPGDGADIRIHEERVPYGVSKDDPAVCRFYLDAANFGEVASLVSYSITAQPPLPTAATVSGTITLAGGAGHTDTLGLADGRYTLQLDLHTPPPPNALPVRLQGKDLRRRLPQQARPGTGPAGPQPDDRGPRWPGRPPGRRAEGRRPRRWRRSRRHRAVVQPAERGRGRRAWSRSAEPSTSGCCCAAAPMVPRRRRRRPWYRTRAYRLARTAMIVAVLVTVVRCGGHHQPAGARPGRRAGARRGAGRRRPPAAPTDAPGPPSRRPRPSPPRRPGRCPGRRRPACASPPWGSTRRSSRLRLGPDRQLGTPPLDKTQARRLVPGRALAGRDRAPPSPSATATPRPAPPSSPPSRR